MADDLENRTEKPETLGGEGVVKENGSSLLPQKAAEMMDDWQGQLDLAKKKLIDAEGKAQDHWDLYLRARAEVENVRRRFLGEAESTKKFAIEKLGREILLVVDSLEQGLQASEGQTGIGMREGMELTLKLLLDTLDKFGIRQINPLGEPFNPLFHEALSIQSSQEMEPNRVMMVVQTGFVLHERLLRPARVIVSKKEDG